MDNFFLSTFASRGKRNSYQQLPPFLTKNIKIFGASDESHIKTQNKENILLSTLTTPLSAQLYIIQCNFKHYQNRTYLIVTVILVRVGTVKAINVNKTIIYYVYFHFSTLKIKSNLNYVHTYQSKYNYISYQSLIMRTSCAMCNDKNLT